MRLKNCTVWNFGSYPFVGIDFADQGICLISGPTGAGKSTIPDMPCWVLFGVTAKDGAVDEVRSWKAEGEPTKGVLTVELPDGFIMITRVRGKAAQNDLYWSEGNDATLHRGKDITETQKMLEERLGISADLYLSSAYFHEFSATGSFFVAKASDRRDLFEKVADLDLPARLAEGASEEKKQAKKSQDSTMRQIAQLEGALQAESSTLKTMTATSKCYEISKAGKLEALRRSEASFEADRASKVSELEKLADKFEHERGFIADGLLSTIAAIDAEISGYNSKVSSLIAVIASISAKCTQCGSPSKEHQSAALDLERAKGSLQRAEQKMDSALSQLSRNDTEVNPYLAKIKQAKESLSGSQALILSLEAEPNPYTDDIRRLKDSLETTRKAQDDAQNNLQGISTRISRLSRLYDLSFTLRGELLKKAVKEIEISTNRYLETHFDAEIRVSFSLDSTDKLNVSIQKSGYECVYKQLSKGQRGLLKISFVLSIMEAASNRAGKHMGALFLDEALDGLDSQLKVKAFTLFEELSQRHETIMVIDHSPELYQMFHKRLKVTMEGDVSQIEIEDGE